MTRHPGDGGVDVALTAFAFVESKVERRFDDQGSERFVRVGNLRFKRGTDVDDRDEWTVNSERWSTVRVSIKEPSVRVFIERHASRTVGGPGLKEFSA